jgi:GR25 family glycosyltransferase involved in LPS biosynthesis
MVTWDGIKIADKGFLINLEEREDRLKESLSELKSNNIVGVEKFNAIKIIEDSDNGWTIRGCTHSHMEILKSQVENKWEKVIIFEDDFFLDICDIEIKTMSNDMITRIYNTDFDLFFLGACLLEPSNFVNDYLIKPNKFVQTTTYLTSLKFAKYVVDNFNYLDKELVTYGEQIDSYYSVLATKTHWRINSSMKGVNEIKEHNLKIYFHKPVLFNQRDSYSNITNTNTSYSRGNNKCNLFYYPK